MGLKINWKGFDPSNVKHRDRVVLKLNEFLVAPALRAQMVRAKIAELTSDADTSDWAAAKNVIDVIQTDVGDSDLAWQLMFDVVDMKNSGKSSMDVLDVSSGLTFAKVNPGEPAKIFKVAGAKNTISFDMYGGGIGFLKKWYDDQEHYKITEQANDFRFKYYDEKAAIAYALMVAVTTAGTFATDDVTTINNAVAAIIVASHKTLPGVNDRTAFLLYCAPALKARMTKALKTVLAYQPTVNQLIYSVQLISTPYITDTTHYWIVAPKAKNKWGERMDLLVLSETDIVRYAETVVGWGRYGGFINSAQVRRCNLS